MKILVYIVREIALSTVVQVLVFTWIILEVHTSCETTKQLISSLKDLPNHPRKLQSHLNSKLKDKNFHRFLQDCQSKKDMARVISCGGPTAGCWVDAIPSSQVYTLSNGEFCTALLQLGASLPALRALDSCIEQCEDPIDNFEYHLLTCRGRRCYSSTRLSLRQCI